MCLDRQGVVNLKITDEQVMIRFIRRFEDGRRQIEGDPQHNMSDQDDCQGKVAALQKAQKFIHGCT
jgi:hypothetical protein